jgi:hypothetical protein
MNDTDNDEAVSQFLSITGSADAAQAKSYLEMSGNDLQTAISLFLEYQTSGNGMAESSYDDSFGRSSVVAGGGSGQNQVRAPDQTRRMRLLDFDDDGAAAALSMGAGLMNHQPFGPGAGMLGMGVGSLPRMSAFAADDDMDMDNELHGSFRDVINRAVNMQGENQSGRNSPEENFYMSSRATRLSDMFAPPLHLIHSAGGFQGARNVAKDSKRWLLVNLQSDSDFACHALNRDIWRDELCENLVREGFIFWQSVSVYYYILFDVGCLYLLIFGGSTRPTHFLFLFFNRFHSFDITCYRMTQPMMEGLIANVITFHHSLILVSLIREQVDLCFGKKVGLRKIHLLQKHLQSLLLIFAVVTLSIRHPLRRNQV